MKGWIQTFTGRAFFPFNAKPEDIDIRDIAHSLSLLCRFNGHCTRFYSVAEHSIRVAGLVAAQGHSHGTRLRALLHDAAEAYLGDMPRPLKADAAFSGNDGRIYTFGYVEFRVFSAISRRFNITENLNDFMAVKNADDVLLATEARDIMVSPPMPWGKLPEPMKAKIRPWSAKKAEAKFLNLFRTLY